MNRDSGFAEKKEHVSREPWLDGMMGLITGDALGCPVQFLSRKEVRRNPVTDMEGYGTYNLPEGSWTDDSSLALAAFDSLKNGYDLTDIADRFVRWLAKGEYTPFGYAYDVGSTCMSAIAAYARSRDPYTCGGKGEHSNGNGSLMRILPACLYAWEKERTGKMTEEEALNLVHEVSGITHNHLRSRTACGLYYYMAAEILDEREEPSGRTLPELLQEGLQKGFARYEAAGNTELAHYKRLRDLAAFREEAEDSIHSDGYVVHSLEAALWCLLREDTFEACLLCCVNLGEDTDSVAAIAGGLAGLYYGYDAIPAGWLDRLQRRERLEIMILEAIPEEDL